MLYKQDVKARVEFRGRRAIATLLFAAQVLEVRTVLNIAKDN